MRIYNSLLLASLLVTGVATNLLKVDCHFDTLHPSGAIRQQLLAKNSSDDCSDTDRESDTRGCPRREN